VYACIDDLHREVTAHHLQSPTLLIIGEVVAMSRGWQAAQQSGCSLVLPMHMSRGISLPEMENWPTSVLSAADAQERSLMSFRS
jgi:hypothetical protein